MSITIDTLSLYELLKPKLGEKESEALVQSLEQMPFTIKDEVTKKFEERKDELVTKSYFEQKLNDQFKWLVGIMITLFSLTITMMFFLLRK
jgi:hypothetical protein